MKPKLCLLLIFVFSFMNTKAVLADELESMLSGFEDETSSESQQEIDEDLGDLLGGFEEDEEIVSHPEESISPLLPEWLDLTGILSLQSTVNFSQPEPSPGQPDYRGLSMFRGVGELIGDASGGNWKARLGAALFYDAAYHLNGQRDLYSDEFIDTYESEIELNEAYLQLGLGPRLDLKTGRQIVVWGKSDNIRITDILNPLDLRWPGLVDIRYLRLPVTMTRLDYYRGNWNLGGLLIHEPRFNKFPVYNGEFYPLNSPLPDPEEPVVSWSNQQAAVSLNGIFSGWDISFYGAYVYDRQPYFSDLATATREYGKVFFTGTAANVALGNWLIKGEAAFWDGLRFFNSAEKKSRLDTMVGFDYSGFSETTISLEFANRHLFDFDESLSQAPDGQKEDWNQFAFRFTRDFLNDTLHLTLLVSSYGIFAQEGGFERFQLEYDVRDDLKLTGGVVFYQSGDFPALKDVGDNDRLLFEIEYRF